ncbi:hypothetical protein K505DRAFT_363176 [Melanomma pulvis-pyrius CBS 109.77]|uniref:Uncharacterized protein n=1 Tax=Melanomma pulvis-pyrius CBS 109.77 TaxID=1314802 RepID=A0A6A6X742_9PLEO|nr:hypothetical protein K505DRAFT_363176 [Melanomma pulvis-pyrius CBS 109.77]
MVVIHCTSARQHRSAENNIDSGTKAGLIAASICDRPRPVKQWASSLVQTQGHWPWPGCPPNNAATQNKTSKTNVCEQRADAACCIKRNLLGQGHGCCAVSGVQMAEGSCESGARCMKATMRICGLRCIFRYCSEGWLAAFAYDLIHRGSGQPGPSGRRPLQADDTTGSRRLVEEEWRRSPSTAAVAMAQGANGLTMRLDARLATVHPLHGELICSSSYSPCQAP